MAGLQAVTRIFYRCMSSVKANPKCFFDVTAGGKQIGRIVMEVSPFN